MNTAARAGLAVAATTSLGAAFLVGVVVGGGTSTTVTPPIGVNPTQPPGGQQIQLVNADLTAPGDCDALLESYVERGLERVGPWGWDGGPVMYFAEDMAGSALNGTVPTTSNQRGASVVEQGSSGTGTNVQEVGVDEPDLAKTDGRLLVRTRDGDLEVHDVTGDRPVELADVDLPSSPGTSELLLAGDTVVVVTTTNTELDRDSTTRLTTYDLSDPAAPDLVDDRSFGGGVVRAVQHDDTIRLVLSSALPDLDFVQPQWWRNQDGALERNQDAVRDSTIADWLPSVTTYGADGEETGSEPAVGCEDVAVPSAEEAALGTMVILGFDADDPAAAEAMGVATDTRLAYVSPTRMYLASSAYSAWGCCWIPELPRPDLQADQGRSRLYAFELDGTGATYVASGVVDGVIEDRWAMDEYDGVLRVAVGQSQETGNFSSVVTLREDGDDLEEIGRVDKLGVNEDIKSVRWFDGLAIVVTFRQIDPLYAIDLTDPDAPQLLGELKIPGYSEYLHPISGQRLIGLGQDASTRGTILGAQAALFDVADLTDPRRTDTVSYPRRSVAAAAVDPRQFTWLPDQDTALAVVSQGWEGRTGWVSVLKVDGNRLDNRMVEVEYGTDVDAVRMLPLSGDRVVLVTGDDVSFFEV